MNVRDVARGEAAGGSAAAIPPPLPGKVSRAESLTGAAPPAGEPAEPSPLAPEDRAARDGVHPDDRWLLLPDSRLEPGADPHAGAAPVQRRADGEVATSNVHAAASVGVATPAQELPHRGALEASFGQDLSFVRAHVGAEAQQSARAMGAEAYATGHDVVLPGDASLHTVAHEVTHVLQQRGGAVQLEGGVGEAGDPYEQHADAVADRVVRGEAVGDLVGEAGAAPAAPAVQRKGTGKTDPKALIPVAKFIEYVEAVEKAYPSDTPTDIITRIRVQYYSGAAFESLIPDAHYDDTYWVVHPDITFSISREMDKGKIDKVNPDAYDHLAAHADENGKGDNPSPYIVMPDGKQVDVGHMMLGLDALIHPSAGDPFLTLGVPNIDPSSWVADLGIAAVWMTYHEEEGKPHDDAPTKLSSPDLEAYYKMSAPEQDLLGDVDSYGMHEAFTSGGGASLSQTLRSYYLGTSSKAAGVKKRWQSFCAKSGLGYTRSGATIVWNAGTRASAISHVNIFNDLYAAGGMGSIWNMMKAKAGGAIGRRSWPHAPTVVDKFLAWVKPQLEAEIAAGP